MAGRFSGRSVLVTGGAKGIGRAIVLAFAHEGAKVGFLDVDAESGRLLADELTERGVPVFFLDGDVSDNAALATFVQEATRRHGPVDAVVNNACIGRRGILSGCTADDFDRVLAIGVRAPYELVRLCLPHFADEASVVNIASTRARQSEPDTESYSAAKGGIVALTHALAASLGPKVRVNSVSPGWIDTAVPASSLSRADLAQHPVGRVGRPEDIAAMVLYLCSPDAGFVTGQDFTVDGGMSRRMVYHGDGGWEFRP